MYLYLVTRPDEPNYDEYDSFVCCTEDADKARLMHPGHPSLTWNEEKLGWCRSNGDIERFNTWPVNINSVEVKYLGVAAQHVERGIVLASFNAG